VSILLNSLNVVERLPEESVSTAVKVWVAVEAIPGVRMMS